MYVLIHFLAKKTKCLEIFCKSDFFYALNLLCKFSFDYSFVAFLNQNFILISKTTPRPGPRRLASSLFSIKINFDFEDDLPLGLRRLWLLIPFLAKNSRLGYFLTRETLIPLFAKNSRLGYFFYANNLEIFCKSDFFIHANLAFG